MLKKLLGEDLFNQVSEKLGDKKIDVVNSGQWIPKSKFDEVIKDKNNYKTKVDELEKSKPDEEKVLNELKQKQGELWNLQKSLILEKQNLGEFKDFFSCDDVESLNGQIDAFKSILGDKFKEHKIDNNYKPDNHKQTDAYAEASKNNDVGGMIGFKMSKIFK